MSDRYKHSYAIRVRYMEVDAQRHVFFSHYLNYCDVALIDYLREIGYAYQHMLASGVDMFYVEASCQYKGRARFDDLLDVQTRVGHLGNTSFRFDFAIYRQATDTLIATSRIVAVTVDAKTEQPIRVPDALRMAVARFEGEPGEN